jgi:hypothetical protein
LDGSDEYVTLPDQAYAGLGGAAAVDGQWRLLLAVLEDALQTFQKYATASDVRGRALFREVEEWFMEADTGATLSFEYISETVGLEADRIRGELQRWRERRLQRVHQLRPRPQPGDDPDAEIDRTLPGLKKASGA